MPLIIIGNTPINFPSTAESPIWSESIIQFAQAVEAALNIAVGPNDVPPQTLIIDSYNPGSNVDIPNLQFSTSEVRGAYIYYTVYRNTSLSTVSENGVILAVYNPTGSVNEKWTLSREYTGESSVTISMTDTGQAQLSTATLSGTGHNGILSYYAKALQQS
jgi:hypothetical protein